MSLFFSRGWQKRCWIGGIGSNAASLGQSIEFLQQFARPTALHEGSSHRDHLSSTYRDCMTLEWWPNRRKVLWLIIINRDSWWKVNRNKVLPANAVHGENMNPCSVCNRWHWHWRSSNGIELINQSIIRWKASSKWNCCFVFVTFRWMKWMGSFEGGDNFPRANSTN